MAADPRLFRRSVLALLCGALALLMWSERRSASGRLAALSEEKARAARSGAVARQAEDRRFRLSRVLERLAERADPPAGAAALRDRLLATAAARGVELSASRFQPLFRPPSGTAGSEAQITALGGPSALTGFLAAIEGSGWPLRVERAQLGVRGGQGTLTATLIVLWPDPAAAFTADEELRLAADPRLDALSNWLETARPRDPPEPAAARAPPPDSAPPAAALAQAAEPPPPDAPPPVETPELHGFVHLGPGVPVRAALFYRGETTLVSTGDRLGEYTVIELQPSDTVLLARPGAAPLRLRLPE